MKFMRKDREIAEEECRLYFENKGFTPRTSSFLGALVFPLLACALEKELKSQEWREKVCREIFYLTYWEILMGLLDEKDMPPAVFRELEDTEGVLKGETR